MAKASREQVAHRRDEILDSCCALYEMKPFREITFGAIAERTSISRPSIYNYFDTIGEIFLGLLQREYEAWIVELEALREEEPLPREQFCNRLAASLERRRTMLKIQSLNLHEIEDSSRIERLIDFKVSYCRSIKALDGCLKRHFPQMTEKGRRRFRLVFLPFLNGAYPCAEPTPKQLEAMQAAGIPRIDATIYDLVNNCLLQLLPEGRSTQ